MKTFLVFAVCPFLIGITVGEILAKFPPGTKQCFLWYRYLAIGETYKPFAKNEHDECFEAFCSGDEREGLVLQGQSCPRNNDSDGSEPSRDGCRFVIEPGVFPICCPRVNCTS